MRRFVALVGACASWAWCAGATAQTRVSDEAPPEGEATVTAPSRRAERSWESDRALSTDDRESAERALARDVGERLEEQPGVFVQRTTSASAAPLIRGLGGQRTLLLFDGMRLNDSLTRVGGNALLNLIDPSSVRRVEVVRGPASVLYGSDAIGGVVAVTPLDAVPHPGEPARVWGETTLRAAGAEQSLSARGVVEGEAGPFGALASGAVGRAGRVINGDGLAQPFTGHDDWSASARAVWAPTEGQRAGAAFQTAGIVDAPRPDVSTREDQRVYRLQQRDVGYGHWRGRWGGVTVSARGGAMRREEVRDRIRGPRLDVERDVVWTAHASAQVDVAYRAARVSAGFDLARDAVSSVTDAVRDGVTTTGRGRYVDGSAYLTGGLFGLWQQRLSPRWSFAVGGRLALVSATAPADGETPALDALYLAPVASAGLRWDPVRGAAVLLNVLGGFRAPNLDDYQALGSGARSFDTPNDELGPERSYTVELGLRWARGPVTASVWAHGSRLDGLVARVPSTYMGMTEYDGRRVYTRENASEAWMAGAEAEVAVRSRWGLYASVAASYTWAEATVPDDDGVAVVEPMAKVPPGFGRLAVGVRRPRWWVDAVLTGALPQDRLARSDRDDVRLCPDGPDVCTAVPGWASAALRVGARANDYVSVALAVENVFGATYTPYGAGFMAPGVNVISQVRIRTR